MDDFCGGSTLRWLTGPANLAFLLTSLLALFPASSQAQSGGMLRDLTRIREGAESRRVSSYNRSGASRDRFEDIADGERRPIFDVEGAGIINHIWVTIAPPPGELARNDIILRTYWDGEQEPSVEAPIGPSFGQGWEESHPFTSLPLAVGPRDGRSLVSYFQMPFSESARIEIENDTGQSIGAFYYYVDYA